MQWSCLHQILCTVLDGDLCVSIGQANLCFVAENLDLDTNMYVLARLTVYDIHMLRLDGDLHWKVLLTTNDSLALHPMVVAHVECSRRVLFHNARKALLSGGVPAGALLTSSCL